MPKARSQFICQQCGYASARWLGRCPECQAWDSLTEESAQLEEKSSRRRGSAAAGEPSPLSSVSEEGLERIPLPFPDLHQVLGGGLTRGSVVLLAGDPGIGKSTLLLQLLGKLARGPKERPLLYVSGEESSHQIKQRARRLHVENEGLLILPETQAADVIAHIEKSSPEIVVVDSVQALYWPELASIPGSISQVREVADRLVRMAKERGITVFLVGHVTKEGSIAGPMALEHLVDTILFFEGEKGHPYRILRCTKNRFGPTNEIAVYDMQEGGLSEVANPSEFFLRDRPEEVPGTVVFPAVEGSRPLLVEVQGLASRSFYGMPLRTAVGFDKNRLTMLLAVLEKRAGLRLSDQDVYVNVVGGIRLTETAADLAVAAAVVSSFSGKRLPPKSVVFGEIGLTGEVRAVARGDLRLKEAAKLGFRFALVPPRGTEAVPAFETRRVKSVEALAEFIRRSASGPISSGRSAEDEVRTPETPPSESRPGEEPRSGPRPE